MIPTERREVEHQFYLQNHGIMNGETAEQVILDNIAYRLVKTTKRLTFDILLQNPNFLVTWYGDDDGDYYDFTASNGYHVISRSVMDIQTERIWILGASMEDRAERSGSMVFGTNEKRDIAYEAFHHALWEWNEHVNTILGVNDED
jgi:hypothetical protein